MTQVSHRHGTNEIPTIDETNTLVFVAPTNAKIQISSLEPICSDTQIIVEAGTQLHPADQNANYMNHDLIYDAMNFCHQGGYHLSLLQSIKNLKSLLWIPNSVKRMTAFYDACTHCIPRATAQTAIGNSIRVTRRWYEIIIDHKVLPQDMVDATNHAGVLSICCNACRGTRFLPVCTLNANDAAMKLFTGWISIFGSPAIVRSDNGSAFISNMMDAFRRMMGIKTWDFSCPSDPTHHAPIETHHRELNAVLNVPMNKGDLSSQTLELYCLVASQRHNQYIHDMSGFTPHQLMFGEPPRHQHNFMIVPSEQEIADFALTPMDSKFGETLKSCTRDTLVYVHYKNDDRIKKETAHRLTDLYNKRRTAFEHRVDDIVSYDG